MIKLLHPASVLTAALALGCGEGYGQTAGWTTAGDGGGDGGGGGGGSAAICPKDPADGPVDESCGIWVSAFLGSDEDPGTQSDPVRSLARAIELAAAGPRRVYACNNMFDEQIVVPGHVSLHGGFNCFEGWTYIGAAARSGVLAPGPTGLAYVQSDVVADLVSNPEDWPYLTDFYIEAGDGVYPGGASIGLFVRADLPLQVLRCEVVAGNGADGAPGAEEVGTPAPTGAPGMSGADACSAAVSKGGTPVQSAWGDFVSAGGKGGDSGPLLAENGQDGGPDSTSGKGGLGEQMSPACTDGGIGTFGMPGVHGAGGELDEQHYTEEGHTGGDGHDGTDGTPGNGGGGGGATFGSVAVCGAATPGGAAGGSGGAGGNGGKAGKGGGRGGSSLGIAARITNAHMNIAYTAVHVGKGGNGGKGGDAQDGGMGGPGGMGGKGAGTIKPGCKGGPGGKGGPSGAGGGGIGGSALCFTYVRPNPPNFLWGNKCYLGEGGAGGMGGWPSDLTAYGAAGFATDISGMFP